MPASQSFCEDCAWRREVAVGTGVHPNGGCLLSPFSLFVEVVFCQVTADTEPANTEPSGGNTHMHKSHIDHSLKS